jgi:hypothetical protein
MAGLNKVTPANGDYYREVIHAYGVLNDSRLQQMPLLIGMLELATALSLLFPMTRYYGTLAASVLLLVYLGLILAQIARGNTGIDCGCAGSARDITISNKLVFRNLLLFLLALLCFGKNIFLEPGTVLQPLSIVLAIIMTLLYASIEQLQINAGKLVIFSNKNTQVN